uniref:Uncharacterized protein n=1 Tax=Plectus sambesii TaxID=2011161 RepID=A0A914XNR0_9BILA
MAKFALLSVICAAFVSFAVAVYDGTASGPSKPNRLVFPMHKIANIATELETNGMRFADTIKRLSCSQRDMDALMSTVGYVTAVLEEQAHIMNQCLSDYGRKK